jgi:hypothetical protein
MQRLVRLSLAAFLVANLSTPAGAQRPPDAVPQEFRAFAVSTGGVYTRPVASSVDITITRWSTPGETERLLTTVKENGAEALLDAVRDAKSVGTIRTPGNLAYDLRYAQQEMIGDGIQRIILITDRPISMWEAVNRPRSYDYPFTLIELRINKEGEGVGKLNIATRIGVTRTGKMVQLENFDSTPIHLNEVRRTR